jgi:hypothetical protein
LGCSPCGTVTCPHGGVAYGVGLAGGAAVALAEFWIIPKDTYRKRYVPPKQSVSKAKGQKQPQSVRRVLSPRLAPCQRRCRSRSAFKIANSQVSAGGAVNRVRSRHCRLLAGRPCCCFGAEGLANVVASFDVRAANQINAIGHGCKNTVNHRLTISCFQAFEGLRN